jgi:hypothetical protein
MTENGTKTGEEHSPAVKRAAVFVGHAHWDLCASRIALLRALNPEVSIHCILGGRVEEHDAATTLIAPLTDSFWTADGAPQWQWQHTDLVIRNWHRSRGRALAFDVLHVIQWDLLLFAPLRRLYAHVPGNALALTGLTRLDDIAPRWHWATVEPERTETLALIEWARQRWNYRPRACLGPGVALPRVFLDRYTDEDIPEIGHDEVRLPLFGTVFGFPLVDTGFYPQWFDATSERLFHANGGELRLCDLRDELSAPSGRRAFHPCRLSFTPQIVLELAASAR